MKSFFLYVIAFHRYRFVLVLIIAVHIFEWYICKIQLNFVNYKVYEDFRFHLWWYMYFALESLTLQNTPSGSGRVQNSDALSFFLWNGWHSWKFIVFNVTFLRCAVFLPSWSATIHPTISSFAPSGTSVSDSWIGCTFSPKWSGCRSCER